MNPIDQPFRSIPMQGAVFAPHGVRLTGLVGINALDDEQFETLLSKLVAAKSATEVEALVLPYRGGWA